MNAGRNIAFIACQPRSGSTLLQKILGSHSDIHTTSEPWVMLHPVYALREQGVVTEYDVDLARTGLQTFIDELPEGEQDYLDGLRRMYGHLYQQALSKTDAKFFLDKTPRYYFILQELKAIFPDARFILLFRHPLAVLSSILRTWVEDRWLTLSKHRQDLIEAPARLLSGSDTLGDAAVSIRYEDLVRDPAGELKVLCKHLDVNFEDGIIEYGADEGSEWELGDPENVYAHSRPQTSSVAKWANPDGAQEWRLLHDYVEFIGETTFERLGYNYDDCLRILNESRPPSSALRYTHSLDWLLSRPSEDRTRWERHTVQFNHHVRNGGAFQAFRYLTERFRMGIKQRLT
jgi:hypothetical protein